MTLEQAAELERGAKLWYALTETAVTFLRVSERGRVITIDDRGVVRAVACRNVEVWTDE